MTKDEAKEVLKDVLPKMKLIYPNLVAIKKVSIGGKYTKRLFCELVFSDGTKKHTQVARVLLESKLGRVLDKKETVDHIDGDALNNSVDNLQVLTRAENARKGPHTKVYGIDNGRSKLTNNQVLEIKELQKSYVKGSGQDYRLAEKYNVGKTAITSIRHGRSWK